MIRRGVFWSGIALLAFTYFLFPALLLTRGRLRPRPVHAADISPGVSVVIAARNEEQTLPAKLANLDALDYPPDKLEVIIASDGSDDATNDIVAARAQGNVRLLALPRVGKAEALNRAVAAATQEIVVFSDANSLYAPDALRHLVRPFADAAVGGVAGDQQYVDVEGAEATAGGERGYWTLDRALKLAETAAGNVISATGAIYAVRRSLIRPIPDGVTDDFMTSTAVVAAGRRLVFEPKAVAFEPIADSARLEFGRKVRIMTRGLRGVVLRRQLLDPRRHGFYSLQLIWHKLLRRLMIVPLAAVALSSASLWRGGRVYRALAAAQALLYGLGALGLVLRRHRIAATKIFSYPAYFVLVNAASLRAVHNVLTRRTIVRWEPPRERRR